jgi:pimeloyl-ACP methyl ester carboxylesterase
VSNAALGDRVAGVPWHAESGADGGPLIVLVHGTMDRAAGMLALARRLDERVGGRLRILRYDRRGYGRSSHLGPFEMEHQVADLVGLIADRRAVVVGHSFGGNVALATAAHHPSLVAGVVVYETPLSWEPWWPRRSTTNAVAASAADAAGAAEIFMRRLIGDQRWDGLPERTRATRRAEGPAMLGELTDARERPPWQYAAITMPLAVGCGSRGAEHHRDGMRRLAASVPGSMFAELDDVGHAAPTTDPTQFVDTLVLPLLERVGAPWA